MWLGRQEALLRSGYDRGLARLADRWAGTGEPGARFRDDHHVYANDLDLFGPGSLFELLSTARTRAGEAMLARWLTVPADPAEIHERQAAVEELSSMLDLREQLALSGTAVRASVDTDRLLDCRGADAATAKCCVPLSGSFTASVLVAILYLALTSVWYPLSAVVMLAMVSLHRFRDAMSAILSKRDAGVAANLVADALTHRSLELDALADVLTQRERARFEGSRLVLLQSRLADERCASSCIIRRLRRLSEMHDSQQNAATVPLGLFLVGAHTGHDWICALALAVAGSLVLVRDARGFAPRSP